MWQLLYSKWKQYPSDKREINELIDIFIASENITPILKSALNKGGERMLALYVLERLSPIAIQPLFPELIYGASSINGSLDKIREMIAKLPRDWVITHIEALVEPYLTHGTSDKSGNPLGTEEEFGRFLELYEVLDQELTERLMIRAMHHEDRAIRDLGEWYRDYRLNRGTR
jgi:hypothetical protein